MLDKSNNILEQENYFDGYKEKAKELLQGKKEEIDIDELFFKVFQSEHGQKLIEIFKNRFLLPGFVHPATDNADRLSLYYEGFKEAFRMIINSVDSYKLRIDSESKDK